uniref:(northern house mosquito) hypothetical protein n=1 Tax=Culex pipiens TaxID=7175 RepID=A0A8D8E1H4_CULPI
MNLIRFNTNICKCTLVSLRLLRFYDTLSVALSRKEFYYLRRVSKNIFQQKKNTNHSNQMKNTHSMIANTFVRARTYTQTHRGQVARAKSWRKVTAREKITARNERKEWLSQSRTLLTHFSLRVFQKKI